MNPVLQVKLFSFF
jgi:hypothetical protein